MECDNSSMCLATPAMQQPVKDDKYYTGWQLFIYYILMKIEQPP